MVFLQATHLQYTFYKGPDTIDCCSSPLHGSYTGDGARNRFGPYRRVIGTRCPPDGGINNEIYLPVFDAVHNVRARSLADLVYMYCLYTLFGKVLRSSGCGNDCESQFGQLPADFQGYRLVGVGDTQEYRSFPVIPETPYSLR